MPEIKVLPITEESVQCASYVCSHPDDVGLENADKGMMLKDQWARNEIKQGFTPGFFALLDGKPAGVFNLEHRKDTGIIVIKCVWVRRKEHWDKGVASKIWEKLLHYAKTTAVFDGKPAKAIVTQPFDGGFPEQKKWYEFMIKKGFVQTPEENCVLYYPIEPGYIYHMNPDKDGIWPKADVLTTYNLQPEDKEKIVIIEDPDICPYFHVFYANTIKKILELKPNLGVAWLNSEIDVEEVKKRGSFRGMVVRGNKITTPSYVYDKFMEEINQYLK